MKTTYQYHYFQLSVKEYHLNQIIKSLLIFVVVMIFLPYFNKDHLMLSLPYHLVLTVIFLMLLNDDCLNFNVFYLFV